MEKTSFENVVNENNPSQMAYFNRLYDLALLSELNPSEIASLKKQIIDQYERHCTSRGCTPGDSIKHLSNEQINELIIDAYSRQVQSLSKASSESM